jgi:hypothetical protein
MRKEKNIYKQAKHIPSWTEKKNECLQCMNVYIARGHIYFEENNFDMCSPSEKYCLYIYIFTIYYYSSVRWHCVPKSTIYIYKLFSL